MSAVYYFVLSHSKRVTDGQNRQTDRITDRITITKTALTWLCRAVIKQCCKASNTITNGAENVTTSVHDGAEGRCDEHVT